MGVSDRLAEALELRERTIRSLHESLKGSKIKGTGSYSSVHAYVNGDVMPPLEFLLAAAEELRVRPSWLVLGEGEKTEQQQSAREQVEEVVTKLAPELIHQPIQRHFPLYDRLPETSRHMLFSVWAKRYEQLHRRLYEGEEGPPAGNLMTQAAEEAAQAAMAPLHVFEVAAEDVSGPQAEVYTHAIIPALMAALSAYRSSEEEEV